MDINKIERKYISNVKKHLKCFNKSKTACINSLKQIIAEQEPKDKSDYNSFVLQYGDPRQIAESYMQEIETEELQKYARYKKVSIIISTIVLLIAIVLCVYFIMLTKDTVVYSYEDLPSSPSNIAPFKTDEYGNPIP